MRIKSVQKFRQRLKNCKQAYKLYFKPTKIVHNPQVYD